MSNLQKYLAPLNEAKHELLWPWKRHDKGNWTGMTLTSFTWFIMFFRFFWIHFAGFFLIHFGEPLTALRVTYLTLKLSIWVRALLSYFEDYLYLLLNNPLLVGYSPSNQFLLLQPPTVVVKTFDYSQFWRTHFAWGTSPLFTWGVLSNLRDPFLSGNLKDSYIQHRRPARGQLVALKATF